MSWSIPAIAAAAVTITRPKYICFSSSVNCVLILKMTWRWLLQSESWTTSPYGYHCFDSGKYSTTICKLLKLSPYFNPNKWPPCLQTIYFSSHDSFWKWRIKVENVVVDALKSKPHILKDYMFSNFYNQNGLDETLCTPKFLNTPTTWSNLLKRVKSTPQVALMISKHYIFHFSLFLLIFRSWKWY